MKRVFGRVEVVFDLVYLCTALGIGSMLLISAEDSRLRLLAGAMAVVLAGGDAFHLIPRIGAALGGQEEKFRSALGRGKLITSITMTVFYLLLWQLGLGLFSTGDWHILTWILYGLALVRVILCLLPGNEWTKRYPPVYMGVLRNTPFFLMGLIVAGAFYMQRAAVGSLGWMWLAVLLSFLCYLPVVLFSNKNPKVGMLMLPKTCMYLWMLGMCVGL